MIEKKVNISIDDCGTVTYDGSTVSFISPKAKVSITGKFNVGKLKGKTIHEFWKDPRFISIIKTAIKSDDEMNKLEYHFGMTSEFIKSDGFYCASGFPQHMGGGDDDAIIAISENGKKVHIAYLEDGKKLKHFGFEKMTDLCEWTKTELSKLIQTYSENTGSHPDIDVLFRTPAKSS